MERRGRLTYERLCNRFERLHDAIDSQFPDPKDHARAQDLQQVIDDALLSARAGMSGGVLVSPFQLKREVEARIVEIHERHNEVDEREEQITGTSTKHADNDDGDIQVSALSHLDPAPNPTAIKRSSPPSPSSGKENALRPRPTKPPAVRKTTITKRAASKKPPSSTPSTSGIKKRPTRRPHTQPSFPTTTSPADTNDEADRRAAATALLDLSERIPPSSIALPLSSPTTPPTRGRKRRYSVYADQDTPPASDLYPEPSVSAAKKRVMSEKYEPVPRLDGVVARRGFAMGVEYAVRYCLGSSLDGKAGEDVVVGLLRFVGREMEVETVRDGDGKGEYGGAAAEKAVRSGFADVKSSGGQSGGKGFWEVI